MSREFVSAGMLEDGASSRLLRAASIIASGLSATWTVLLVGLVIRCRATVHPYPVLAKFAPFKFHFHFTEAMLRASPIFAALAVLLLLCARHLSKNDDSNRCAGWVLGASVLAGILVAAGNPAGIFSWLLS